MISDNSSWSSHQEWLTLDSVAAGASFAGTLLAISVWVSHAVRYFSDPFCPAECAYSLDPALLEKLGCFHSTDLIDLLTIAGTGMATVIGWYMTVRHGVRWSHGNHE